MAKSPVKNSTLKRAKRFYIVAMLLVAALIVRIVWIQFFSGQTKYNAERLQERIFSWQEVPAHRGAILDATGEPLALSIYNYQVEMDYGCEGFDSLATFKAQSDSLSKLLAQYFKDKPAKQYAEAMLKHREANYKLTYKKDSMVLRSEDWWGNFVDRLGNREFVAIPVYDTMRNHTPIALLPRKVSYTEWQTLKKWPILNYNMGITYNLSRSDSRVYPNGELARQTIGKINSGGRDYGIEKACSLDLAAHPGKIKRQRIARGFYGKVVEEDNVDPVDGSTVVSTINIEVQDVVSKALEKQLIVNHGDWGTAMVMEVSTGKIIAMANLGRTPSGKYIEDFNYALKTRNEPGSTLKAVSVMGLLEVGGMSPSQKYYSGNGDTVYMGSAHAVDSHRGYGNVDLRTATTQSLNGYFATAVYDHFNDNPSRYTDFMHSLHLDRTVGLEEFGAISPSFRKPGDSNWYENNTIAFLGYGYGVELTPLHTLTLYNAIANNGCMVAPQLIERIERDDEVVRNFEVDVLNPQICSSRHIDTLRSYLELVASEGTAAKYMGGFKGFKVGAKTGTAQVAQGAVKYKDGHYLGSMAVFMPADNPRYTIYTAIYTRRRYKKAIYGAALTGEAQRTIVQYLYNREKGWCAPAPAAIAESRPTKIKGGSVNQVNTVSSVMTSAMPRQVGENPWGEVVVGDDNQMHIKPIDISGSAMPNVVGMGLKDALFVLESCGLEVETQGKGAVSEQSIKAGTKIKRGEKVKITLKVR